MACIESLVSKVESLQGRICYCNNSRSWQLSRLGTCEDPHKLECILDNEYVTLPIAVVTMLIPIDIKEPQVLGWILHFGDEGSITVGSQCSSLGVTDLSESEDLILIYVSSSLSEMASPICSG